ncbi:MAG TPA: 3-deoxy-8-phosphooctulonate synthase [Deltaproteobacteria bacterium]|nr:3-deoxy-8-phosphooctulonate synthase [Deltaproteobacteria bacterium]
MPTEPVQIGSITVGDGGLVLIAGPCVLEGPERVLRIARGLDALTRAVSVPWIFKASFDKANRTSGASPRGPGLAEGLALLAEVRRQLEVPVTTDVHLPRQADVVAEHVDLLQVPAFLCRQTDLLRAVGATGRPVNLKKGQFVDPRAMGYAIDKVRSAGDGGVLLTERGTTFGHGDLVVDFRGLLWMRALGVPVVYDATHSVQRPSAAGDRSAGDRPLAPALARGAVAVGIDAIFAEVHDAPDQAWSDADLQLPLGELGGHLSEWIALHRALTALHSLGGAGADRRRGQG